MASDIKVHIMKKYAEFFYIEKIKHFPHSLRFAEHSGDHTMHMSRVRKWVMFPKWRQCNKLYLRCHSNQVYHK